MKQVKPATATSEVGWNEPRATPPARRMRIEVFFPPTDIPAAIAIHSCERTMNAMIIYDKGDSARQASALLKRASDRADEATQWDFSAWRVDMLEHPLLAEEALEHGVEVHLIMLAVAPQKELPPVLLKWLETWAARRQVEDAALALFNGDQDDRLSATATPALLEFTGRHGLSLIAGAVSPADNKPPGLRQPLIEPEMAEPARTGYSQSRPSWAGCEHWGINE
jgi:hypothetical protein